MAKRSYLSDNLRLILWLLVMILVQIHAALWIERMDYEYRSKDHSENEEREKMKEYEMWFLYDKTPY